MTIEIGMINLDSLVDKTVFLKLSFGVFGNFRKANVQVKSDANTSRLKHQKQLLDSPELETIRKADTNIRAIIDLKCLPAKKYDVGVRFLPVGAVEYVYALLKEYQTVTRPVLVQAFLDTLATQVQDAKVQLGEHFNPNDYPSYDEMKSEFEFTFSILSFSVPGHLKTIAPALWEAEREKAHKVFKEAAEELVLSLRTGVHELVLHLADKLSASNDGKTKRLHATTVSDLVEFLNSFDIRNVTDDKQLKTEIDKLKSIMEGADVEKIRNSDNLKSDLHAKLTEAAVAIGALVEVKGRKFRDVPKAEPESVTEPAGHLSTLANVGGMGA